MEEKKDEDYIYNRLRAEEEKIENNNRNRINVQDFQELMTRIPNAPQAFTTLSQSINIDIPLTRPIISEIEGDTSYLEIYNEKELGEYLIGITKNLRMLQQKVFQTNIDVEKEVKEIEKEILGTIDIANISQEKKLEYLFKAQEIIRHVRGSIKESKEAAKRGVKVGEIKFMSKNQLSNREYIVFDRPGTPRISDIEIARVEAGTRDKGLIIFKAPKSGKIKRLWVTAGNILSRHLRLPMIDY